MPSPIFSFRLPHKEADSLREMSKIFGVPNTSMFLREMIGAMCSGDPQRIKDFNAKLIAKAGEQLTLKLNAVVDEGPVGGRLAERPQTQQRGERPAREHLKERRQRQKKPGKRRRGGKA